MSKETHILLIISIAMPNLHCLRHDSMVVQGIPKAVAVDDSSDSIVLQCQFANDTNSVNLSSPSLCEWSGPQETLCRAPAGSRPKIESNEKCTLQDFSIFPLKQETSNDCLLSVKSEVWSDLIEKEEWNCSKKVLVPQKSNLIANDSVIEISPRPGSVTTITDENNSFTMGVFLLNVPEETALELESRAAEATVSVLSNVILSAGNHRVNIVTEYFINATVTKAKDFTLELFARINGTLLVSKTFQVRVVLLDDDDNPKDESLSSGVLAVIILLSCLLLISLLISITVYAGRKQLMCFSQKVSAPKVSHCKNCTPLALGQNKSVFKYSLPHRYTNRFRKFGRIENNPEPPTPTKPMAPSTISFPAKIQAVDGKVVEASSVARRQGRPTRSLSFIFPLETRSTASDNVSFELNEYDDQPAEINPVSSADYVIVHGQETYEDEGDHEIDTTIPEETAWMKALPELGNSSCIRDFDPSHYDTPGLLAVRKGEKVSVVQRDMGSGWTCVRNRLATGFVPSSVLHLEPNHIT